MPQTVEPGRLYWLQVDGNPRAGLARAVGSHRLKTLSVVRGYWFEIRPNSYVSSRWTLGIDRVIPFEDALEW